MSSESKKNAPLLRHLGAFFIRLNKLVSIFTSKKGWKCLRKNQLTQSENQKKGQGVKSISPYAN